MNQVILKPKIYVNVCDTRFLPRLYKELSQINNKKKNNPRKTGKRFKETFQKSG